MSLEHDAPTSPIETTLNNNKENKNLQQNVSGTYDDENLSKLLGSVAHMQASQLTAMSRQQNLRQVLTELSESHQQKVEALALVTSEVDRMTEEHASAHGDLADALQIQANRSEHQADELLQTQKALQDALQLLQTSQKRLSDLETENNRFRENDSTTRERLAKEMAEHRQTQERLFQVVRENDQNHLAGKLAKKTKELNSCRKEMDILQKALNRSAGGGGKRSNNREHAQRRVCMCVFVSMYVCMYVYMCVGYVCMYVCIYMCLCMCVCIDISIYHFGLFCTSINLITSL